MPSKLSAHQSLKQSVRFWALGVLAMLACADLHAVPPTEIERGYKDFAYPGAVGVTGRATGEKPENKAWYNDGFWWAVMWNVTGPNDSYRIHQLDTVTQEWVDTGTVVDDRITAKVDTLWDGTNLYVVTHVFVPPNDVNGGRPAIDASERGRLYRYSYNAGTNTYTLDGGFPADVNNAVSETLSLAQDSTGRLWVTWVEDRQLGGGFQVWVNHSGATDDDWGDVTTQPFVVPVDPTASTVERDDISAVVAFGNNIGVMWSNQDPGNDPNVPNTFRFSAHPDSSLPDLDWTAAISATNRTSDDHINLKVNNGDIYAAVKVMGSNNSQIALLMCDTAVSATCSTGGAWSFDTVYQGTTFVPTRPIVLINEQTQRLYVLSSVQDTLNGVARRGIYFKETDATNPTFDVAAKGAAFIRSITSGELNIDDPTSTRDNILTSAQGMVVLASKETFPRNYYHNFTNFAPTIDFSGTPVAGTAPLQVQFTDMSQFGPIAWAWDFNEDGLTDSILQHPTHTFTAGGLYNITLAASNAIGANMRTLTDYITVTAPTTTTITADTPDPSVTGETVTVNFTVAPVPPSTGVPTGDVTVTDGTTTCMDTLVGGMGSCPLTLTTAGNKTLTATYSGDTVFVTSADTEPHVVNKASTTISITSDNPDPSLTGGDVTVNFDLLVVAPGTGMPTGTVTVKTDGSTPSCVATLPATSCTLSIGSPGVHTLTAEYAGDPNYNVSTSGGEPHQVDPGPGFGTGQCDFNSDGKCDILFRDSGTGQNRVWFMNGAMKESAQFTVPEILGVNWQGRGVGDFDGNGHADIVFRNSVTGKYRIWLLNGVNRISDPFTTPDMEDMNTTISCSGDFDADGKADLLLRDMNSGALRIWFMDGAVRTANLPTNPPSISLDNRVGGCGDFNGDGKADIVFRNKAAGGMNFIWLMDGANRIGSEVPIRTLADLNWNIAAAVDVDGDGDADILIRNIVTGDNRIWFMDGTTFLNSQPTAPAVMPLTFTVVN